MRAVLDTNVVVSALLWGGTPERLIQAADEAEGLDLFTSEALLAEFERILERPKFSTKLAQLNSSPAELLARYREIARTVQTAPLEEARLRDADDAAVLACALAAQADVIVSGDDDLLALGSYGDISILSPAACMQRIADNNAALP